MCKISDRVWPGLRIRLSGDWRSPSPESASLLSSLFWFWTNQSASAETWVLKRPSLFLNFPYRERFSKFPNEQDRTTRKFFCDFQTSEDDQWPGRMVAGISSSRNSGPDWTIISTLSWDLVRILIIIKKRWIFCKKTFGWLIYFQERGRVRQRQH